MGGRKRGKDSIGENIEQLELSNTAVGNVNWYNHFGKLVVSTWAEYMPPRYMEILTYVQLKTYMWLVIAALSIIAPKWKLTKHPSRIEWLNKLCYIYIIEYIAMRRDKLKLHALVWINLINILLSKRSQTHKKIYMIPFIIYINFKDIQN